MSSEHTILRSIAEARKEQEAQWHRVPFGRALRAHFPLDPHYVNFNNGSFGCIPRAVLEALTRHRAAAESNPDAHIRRVNPVLIAESRAAVASLLNATVDAVVLVPNATTGVNTVLRNMRWSDDGADVILHFSTIYDACRRTIDYVVDTRGGRVRSRCVDITYPLPDDAVFSSFEAAVAAVKSEGLRPRLCLFDTISSRPGVLFPFAGLAARCRAHGILSLVDGAHGIGQLPLDLTALDPDFFVSNCHKWLNVPRGCAVLFVPPRNQPLIPSTLPTSHGYQPAGTGARPEWAQNFVYVGTVDGAAYACITEALRWREVVLGGEREIMRYCVALNKQGSHRMAEVLGTEVMDTESGSLTDCMMSNVALPLSVPRLVELYDRTRESRGAEAAAAAAATTTTTTTTAIAIARAGSWIENALMTRPELSTYLGVGEHGGKIWVRTSAQVYLEVEDYEWCAGVLKELCDRVDKGEHLEGS